MTQQVDRLLVLSPNWLGDAVMALPAIGDLRRHFSHARLIIAARKGITGLFAMAPAVDEIITLEWSGRLWARQSLRADIASLSAVRADASVLLPNSFASAWLVRRADVRERWGYSTDGRQLMLTRAVERPAIRVHQAEYYRRLVKGLGVENGAMDPELAVPPGSVELARQTLRAAGIDLNRRFVVMAPGAAYGGAKRWPPEHFAEVSTRLVREQQLQCVLVGSGADGVTTQWVRALTPEDVRAQVVDVAGSTTLDALAGVMSLASGCLSNDSGAMHLAGAVGVPLIALFGPTRERETTPLSRPGHRVEVMINHVWCRPCMLRECPLDHRCMKGLSPERVFSTMTDLIGRDSAEARAPRTSNLPGPGSPVPGPAA
jgi:heptosyltransferase-2